LDLDDVPGLSANRVDVGENEKAQADVVGGLPDGLIDEAWTPGGLLVRLPLQQALHVQILEIL
jgi:hypothetical protein